MKAGPEKTQGPRRLYLDSSAYLCILLGEEGSVRLSKETSGAELLSSVLLVLETRRHLVRLAREGRLGNEGFKTCIDRLEQDVSLFLLRDHSTSHILGLHFGFMPIRN